MTEVLPGLGALRRALEVEGLVLFQEFLAADEIRTLRAELDSLPGVALAARPTLHAVRDVHLSAAGHAVALLADTRVLRFLTAMLGDDIQCMASSYARYEPGYPGMPLHADAQPYGSELFGPLASAPVSVRLFFFLDELTAERAPFRYIPTSHLSLHADANPYQRFRDHPEAIDLLCQAGACAAINPKMFHAAGANRSDEPRRVFTASYRPVWAGPARRVPAHDEAALARLPVSVRSLFGPPNARKADKRLPIRQAAETLPLGPRRWDKAVPVGAESETL